MSERDPGILVNDMFETIKRIRGVHEGNELRPVPSFQIYYRILH